MKEELDKLVSALNAIGANKDIIKKVASIKQASEVPTNLFAIEELIKYINSQAKSVSSPGGQVMTHRARLGWTNPGMIGSVKGKIEKPCLLVGFSSASPLKDYESREAYVKQLTTGVPGLIRKDVQYLDSSSYRDTAPAPRVPVGNKLFVVTFED